MNRIVIYIFVSLTVLYAVVAFAFAVNGYPGFRQDAICFLPTSYFINHQHLLINPLYDAGVDPITHKFLFYPPLFPYVVALITKLLPANDGEIHVALTFINICSIILILISAYIYIKRNVINHRFILYPFLAVWVIALFSFNEIFEGRPEILCNFFIACFLLNNLNRDRRFSNFINGILIGLNAITSPISTLYLVIITLGLLFYNNNFKLKPIIQTAIGFVLVFSCFVLLYPYHLIDLYHGLIKHSTNVVFNRANAGGDRLNWFMGIYIITPFHTLVGVTFLISICYTLYLLIKQKKIITILCFFLLFASIGYFAFRNVLMSYNMYVLASLYMFLLLVFFVDIINRKIFAKFINASFVILFLLLFSNSLGLFRTTLVFLSTMDKKVSISDLRKDINVLSTKLKKDKKIYITFSLWPSCLDKTNSITSNTVLGSPNDNPSIQYIILQQCNSGQSIAPRIAGYELIKNGFIPDHPMFGKLKIANTYPWYQTAIYERK